MHRFQRGALAALMLTITAVLIAVTPALSQRIIVNGEPADRKPAGTLNARLAKAADISDEKVTKVLKELGPAITAQLAKGNMVELPGLGTFRVVRVPEHRDLVSGRPAMIPAANFVEFRPAGGLADAANAPGAIAVETIPIWQFTPLGNQVPQTRIPSGRVPGSKIQ
jgi:nucleoid DNA-binding protein